MTQFADETDRASHLAQMANESGIDNARWKARPQQVRDENGHWPITECVDCDEPIEPERLELARIRCFDCQSKLEKKGKVYAR